MQKLQVIGNLGADAELQENMLRVRKEHRDFFFYERTPYVAKMAITNIDIEKLGEVWKLTKDKRI